MPRKSLKKRADGLYMSQVKIGIDENGKRIVKSVYGKTQKEVAAKAELIRAKHRKGIDFQAQNESFQSWCDKWLDGKSCGAVQMRAYRSAINHLVPALGDRPLQTLRTSDFQAVINSLAKGDSALSKTTLGKLRMVARQVIQLAVDNRVIEYNCADAIKIPSTAAAPTTRESLTDEQIQWIHDTPHRAQLPSLIMLYCGLRRGEVMALRYSDIDIGNRLLHVRRSVKITKTGTGEEVAGAKTAAGVRTVPIPGILLQYMPDNVTNLHELITSNAAGGLHGETSWKHMWNSYIKELNIKYGEFIAPPTPNGKNSPIVIKAFTAHQLRHTYATMLYESGVDVITARSLLGHEDVSTTLGIYTHLRESHAETQAKKYEEYLSKRAF